VQGVQRECDGLVGDLEQDGARGLWVVKCKAEVVSCACNCIWMLESAAACSKHKSRPKCSSSAHLGLECNGDAYELVWPTATRGRAVTVACACVCVI